MTNTHRDEAVLAHLRYARDQWGAAGPLWDMPPAEWAAAITALRQGGHTIDTVTLTQGDTACNGTGYVLRPEVTDNGAGTDSAVRTVGVDDRDSCGVVGQAQGKRSEEHDIERPSVVTDKEPSATSELVMPEDMRLQALRTEAAFAAGTLPPARPDDLTELVERITQLRERIAARTEQAGMSSGSTDDARRERLNRWHRDDSTAERGCAVETRDSDDSGDSGDSDVAGWSG